MPIGPINLFLNFMALNFSPNSIDLMV